MVNAEMRTYNYYLYNSKNEYGQEVLTEGAQGSITMAIYITNQSIQDNINYAQAGYMGLTMGSIDNSYVIQYEEKKLKVLYVNAQGRYKQVFMKEI